MKKSIYAGLCFLLLIAATISCSRDLDDETSILGTWVEVSPEPERTTLYFATGNRLTHFDGDGNGEEYIYRIEGKTLFLRLPGDEEGRSEIFFEQINLNRIKVGNLYPSIPEAQPVFIILDREE